MPGTAATVSSSSAWLACRRWNRSCFGTTSDLTSQYASLSGRALGSWCFFVSIDVSHGCTLHERSKRYTTNHTVKASMVNGKCSDICGSAHPEAEPSPLRAVLLDELPRLDAPVADDAFRTLPICRCLRFSSVAALFLLCLGSFFGSRAGHPRGENPRGRGHDAPRDEPKWRRSVAPAIPELMMADTLLSRESNAKTLEKRGKRVQLSKRIVERSGGFALLFLVQRNVVSSWTGFYSAHRLD
jgi:hypothetical protein